MLTHVASDDRTALHLESGHAPQTCGQSFNRIILPEPMRTKLPSNTMFWRLGRMILGVASPPQATDARARTDGRTNGVDHWVLRVSRGKTSWRQGFTAGDAEQVDIVLETLAEPFRSNVGPGEWVTVIFPRDLTPGLTHDEPHAFVGPLRHAPAKLLGHFILSLAGQMPTAGAEDVPRLAAALHAMIVATLDQGAPAPNPGCRMRARIDEVILANIASARLDPARIAELVGVSRSTLYRLFEGSGGVAAHVQRIRLNGVRADLADPAKAAEPISRVAERWGFYSVTSFNRSFRAAFGMTPGEARKGARACAQERSRRVNAHPACAPAPR